ncbi:tetratricopeptide repeat protein [Ruminococcaceae bacterium OttesenSCG-928-A11]|nr:tetratricopeptide repeat protein [Ruminococcaceae bacterium OttesenSCG-928-A11]
MLGFLSILLICLIGVFIVIKKPAEEKRIAPRTKLNQQLEKLWKIQQDALRTKKYLRAEKALLLILRADDRNAVAYNRLGMIFAKQGNYEDAIECFEIAQSLAPSASSFHNVGLVHMDVGDYDKAVLAMRQAMEMEENVAFRHISYAQALEKIGDKKGMMKELERAVELEPTPQTLKILAQVYDDEDKKALARSLRSKATRMDKQSNTRKRINQPNKMTI